MKFLKNNILLILMAAGIVFVVVAAFTAPPIPPQEHVQIAANAEQATPEERTQPPEKTPDALIKQGEAIQLPAPIEGVVVHDYNQPQTLPSEPVKIIKQNGQEITINAEIADTAQKTSVGLMFRHSVPDGTGMLFLFEEITEHSFWMKNTFVPLDILFIDADKKISRIHKMAEPYKLDAIPSGGKVLSVLEIGGGQADKLGIAVGDRVENARLDIFREQALDIPEFEDEAE